MFSINDFSTQFLIVKPGLQKSILDKNSTGVSFFIMQENAAIEMVIEIYLMFRLQDVNKPPISW